MLNIKYKIRKNIEKLKKSNNSFYLNSIQS